MSEHEEQVAPAAYSPYKPVVVDELIKALEARRTLGIQRYSVPLQPDNGRDMKRDLVEELLDALVYLQGLRLEEQRHLVTLLHEAHGLIATAEQWRSEIVRWVGDGVEVRMVGGEEGDVWREAARGWTEKFNAVAG